MAQHDQRHHLQRALKLAPTAITGVVVPAKYMVEGAGNAAQHEERGRGQAGCRRHTRGHQAERGKDEASAVVANTSKKPSTQRCTTHQRQYSITERWCAP